MTTPKNKSKVRTPIMSLRVPAKSIQQLNSIAEVEGRSRSDIVRRAIRRELDRLGEVYSV